MSVGDQYEDGPPLERPSTGAFREADTEPDGLRPPTLTPERISANPFEEDLPERATALGELGKLRIAQERTATALERLVAQDNAKGRELGDIKSAVSMLALQVGRLETPIKPNGLSGKRVLVVDDDEGLLDLVERVLGELGCNVTAAASRIEAETVLAAVPRPFHLALVDLHLPSSDDGLELCRWILRAHPSVKTIVMSGLLDVEGLDELPVARLEKIFTLSCLRDAVYGALGMIDTDGKTDPPPAPAPGFAPELATLPSTGRETPEAKAQADAASGTTD